MFHVEHNVALTIYIYTVLRKSVGSWLRKPNENI